MGVKIGQRMHNYCDKYQKQHSKKKGQENNVDKDGIII